MNKLLQKILILIVWVIFHFPVYAQDCDLVKFLSSCGLPPISSPSNEQQYNSGYNNGAIQGLANGMEICRETPNACGINLYANSGRSEEEIKKETLILCQNDPSFCEIDIEQNKEIFIEEGRQICRTDPLACNIELNPDKDKFIQEGSQKCQNDPNSCGIELNPNKDSFIEEGRQRCINNPISCGILVNPNINEIIKETKTQCRLDPSSCDININNYSLTSSNQENVFIIRSFFSLSDGKLYIPAVDVPTALDGTTVIYEVEMQIIPGYEPLSFSITHVVPVEK